MQDSKSLLKVSAVWRGNKYLVEVDSGASLKDLGDELLKLTSVKVETLRLIVPLASNKGSKLLFPFSDEHSCLSLQEASIGEGKSIRMMGVSEDEVEKVLIDAKTDMRIRGFEEEEMRLREKVSYMPRASIKLPQGPYTFCEFRTLQLPGIELNPPPSEALKRMHMLAADPGIVAIMNKHRWRVGIMTEMAPVGYVGVSPKCILGFNKNHGEEISLRLRTDDLKGFRKYESIKKTLLHELAHMVYSEHDNNFYALDKQLKQEAASLDWTKSTGHSLSGVRHMEEYVDHYSRPRENFSQKLGGNKSNQLPSARASSVAAAYHRLSNTIANETKGSEVHEEPDPDDSVHEFSDETKYTTNDIETYDHSGFQSKNEPDPDDAANGDFLKPEHGYAVVSLKSMVQTNKTSEEPDPDDDLEETVGNVASEYLKSDDCEIMGIQVQAQISKSHEEPDPDDSHQNEVIHSEPDPDDIERNPKGRTGMDIDEMDLGDQEIRRIQDSVSDACTRLQNAIKFLRTELNPQEAITVPQTLYKIIRNVMEHPNEIKFKRLRKGNPLIQNNIVNYKAATEILSMIGFREEDAWDETGKPTTYLILKRNDPGLLWLAKSSLETCFAQLVVS